IFLSRSDSEETVSIELADEHAPDNNDDESHYITTHEIQLSELDHDVDYDFELGSCWDFEDDNLVYSFVDYASFDSDETVEGRKILGDRTCAKVESNQAQSNNTVRRAGGGAAVSTKHENDLCDTDKCASTDESLSKHQNGSGNSAGQIHLSIKTTSRAINEPSNVQEKENTRYDAKHELDMSRYVFKSTDAKRGKISDSAKCFIAAPGRLHFGSKLKGKDINEYSSGASSAVSELDDADKEVRNLTARAFRSLACPYFDAINFSTSSDSSASEHGIGFNRWSTFVDLKYGNMTQAKEQNVVSHKSSTSTFEINKGADGKGIKGLALSQLKAPQTKIFALNGDASEPQNATSTTKKIELEGKFEPGQSGVITLTETLNFRCNVNAGAHENEWHAKFELGSEASKQSCSAGETMEGTHKKAIFATSLLKNVISKKMQFEQERKMERGEISEAYSGLSPCLPYKEVEIQKEKVTASDSRGLQRQNSRFSEASSDLTIVSLEELGDIADTKSCDLKDDGQNQNSAFRSWRDGELEYQKEQKNNKTPVGKPSSSADNLGKTNAQHAGDSSKLTKMSHLFVPSIQLLYNENEFGKPQPDKGYSTRAAADLGGGGNNQHSADNTLHVPDAARSAVTSKSPEIKISLRSVKDNKRNPFNIAKLLTPNIGCNAASLIKTADDFKCQALAASLKGESSEKAPHFMVRDIRDNKCKLQTPIHQVRDVRKLVKSSYHFVSLDNNENRVAGAADLSSENKLSQQGLYRNHASLSPIVIKCQSVNTNSNVKQPGNLADRSSPQPPAEGATNGTLMVHRTTGRVPLATTAKQPTKSDSFEVPSGVKIETRAAKRKQEKINETPDRKPESKMANQVALEKLKAAVKTMEQLYVFDRNEWKRKTEPRPITDSHVLSLIASEEQGTGRPPNEYEEESGGIAAQKKEVKESLKMFHIPLIGEDKDVSKSQPLSSGAISNKNVFTFSNSQKAPAITASAGHKVSQPYTLSQVPFSTKTFGPKCPKVPLSLKISQAKPATEEKEKPTSIETEKAFPLQPTTTTTAESENYLTIPVKSHPSDAKPAATTSREVPAVYTFTATGSQSPKRSSVVMETRSPDTPTATIYHHSLPIAMSGPQPQVICFSPSVPPPPHAPAVDHFQQTQRKMLLDPTTGHYYLVDTPVQPTTKRLFDPETGQYVDVPMPQQPITPVPVPVSPLALSPGAYGPTYMIYPGFLPTTTVLPTRTLQTQLSSHSDAEEQEKSNSKETLHMGQQGDVAYMESPYYIPTGKSAQALPISQHLTTRGSKGFSEGKPVISITSQQGPRIIAPPSFDGTTMSFVVEHR
uniref:Chromosome 4 open reading frame 54 n=1 Tax=Lepisosteus oculatus TaxID=7918 RepID=W5LVB3_LEPOC